MITRVKNRLIALGISWKKELIILLSLNILLIVGAILCVFLLNNILLMVILLCLVFAFDFGYYFRICTLEHDSKKKDIYDFVTIFTYLKIFILNGSNVYTALKEISIFAEPKLCERISFLTDSMDEDKSVKPFTEFAKGYSDLIVEQIMVSIYQMIDQGNQALNLIAFESVFDKFADITHANQLDEKEKKLSSMSTTALIGSALLILMVTFGVLLVIGEMVNGI